MTDLECFILGLSQVKTASYDKDTAATALIALGMHEEYEKFACGYDSDTEFSRQFVGTPLHEKAIALLEEEIAMREEELKERAAKDAERKIDEVRWSRRDRIDLEKRRLKLELEKLKAATSGAPLAVNAPVEAVPAVEKAASVQYVGETNNGDSQPPEWPAAALGIESAGRLATPAERKVQDAVISAPAPVRGSTKKASWDEARSALSGGLVGAAAGHILAEKPLLGAVLGASATTLADRALRSKAKRVRNNEDVNSVIDLGSARNAAMGALLGAAVGSMTTQGSARGKALGGIVGAGAAGLGTKALGHKYQANSYYKALEDTHKKDKSASDEDVDSFIAAARGALRG